MVGPLSILTESPLLFDLGEEKKEGKNLEYCTRYAFQVANLLTKYARNNTPRARSHKLWDGSWRRGLSCSITVVGNLLSVNA